MHLPRSIGRNARAPLAAVVLLACSAQITLAQTQTETPSTQPSVPAATQVPTSSSSSAPASAPDKQNPTRDAAPAAVRVPDSTRPAVPGYAPETETERQADLGSTYIPVDSYIYPMALRLYSMGYLNTAFINMRPWTRRSLLHMLQESSPAIVAGNNTEAMDILAKLDAYLASEGGEVATTSTHFDRGLVYGTQALYTRAMGISGQTLRDSFHLGQTIAQDYGRPYEPGFNDIAGFATVNEYGRFSLYVRGEYQHSPSSFGYSTVGTGNPLAPNGLAEALSEIDEINYVGPNQSTIPAGAIAAQNPFRLMEATLSVHLLGHEISGGKSDAWEGPGLGSSMAWSDNAEDIYSFRINRVDPLHVPFVSDLLGPLRYDFFVGSLKGHAYPNEPWAHSEMFSFAPTSNFQFGFERTVIWGGHGHGCLQPNGIVTPCDEPITLGTFFRSFFSVSDTNGPEKYSIKDPGARFSAFNFSWRLPFVSHRITLYTDSISHDDVSPVSAPRRADYRPGIYLSQVPGIPKLDFRVEGVSTDCSTTICQHGSGEYWEVVQRQGYTNKGFIMGDWIGREAMGGQAWLTYHLSADQWVQMEYMKKRTPADFIPGGTSQNQYRVEVLKRLGKDVQLDGWLQVERW
jgi:hypothetical protein